MAEYDAGIIKEFANRLYRQARWVSLRYALAGGIIGWAIVAAATAAKAVSVPLGGWGFVAGAILGLSLGMSKAFQFRLEAQRALVLVQIEENTRKLASTAKSEEARDAGSAEKGDIKETPLPAPEPARVAAPTANADQERKEATAERTDERARTTTKILGDL